MADNAQAEPLKVLMRRYGFVHSRDGAFWRGWRLSLRNEQVQQLQRRGALEAYLRSLVGRFHY